MSEQENFDTEQEQEDLGTGLKVVSFCFPIVGAIIYFVNKDKAPKKAKSACNLALIGFGIGVVLNVISTLLTNM